MKICGIVGSPNKSGNVDLLVSQVLKGASSKGAKVYTLYLNDMHIQPCQSCGVDPYPNYCIYDDDMNVVYTVLESSDGIVLGSPVYFDTVSAQTKLMIDRCNCLMPYVESPDGTSGFDRRIQKTKKGVFVAAAGLDQDFNIILTTVNGFFTWANIKLMETILYAHEDNELGSVKRDAGKMQQAFDAGVKMASRLDII
ncbi:MAG: flavodoxin family protein [Anaerolineales bacterium]|nr:flavodoxin family protein [Anaerolineales bacterium]